jgi:hypothetical protein
MVTRVVPPPEPSETLTDPRELLLGYLDWYRDAVLRKLDGLPEEELRRSRLPSGWTLLACSSIWRASSGAGSGGASPASGWTTRTSSTAPSRTRPGPAPPSTPPSLTRP